MKSQLAQDAPGLLGQEGFIERRRLMGTLAVLYQTNRGRMGISGFHRPLQAAGVALSDMSLHHLDLAPASQRFPHYHKISRALAFVFIVPLCEAALVAPAARGASSCAAQSVALLSSRPAAQRHRTLRRPPARLLSPLQTRLRRWAGTRDHVARISGHFSEDLANGLGGDVGDQAKLDGLACKYPHCPMVVPIGSWGAGNRNHMRRLGSINAWCCFSCRATSMPPSRYPYRTRTTVLPQTPEAAYPSASLQSSTSLSKRRARSRTWALAHPQWRKIRREARSFSGKGKGKDNGIQDSCISHQRTTFVKNQSGLSTRWERIWIRIIP